MIRPVARGVVAAALGLLLLLAGCSREATPPSGTSLARAAESTDDLVRRGRYLALAGNCLGCHTARGGAAYAGGAAIPTPFGTFYGPNLTPDPAHGLGGWTADDFWRALHDGRGRDGALLYPAFPYTNYTRVTRADSDALHAYFMSLAPVAQPDRAHELRFPYNQRWLLHVWRTLYFDRGVFTPDERQTREWNRGAYLVEGLGHCSACHAERNRLGAVAASDDTSGGLIPTQNWYAPALTGGGETTLADWETRDIAQLLGTGMSARGAVFGPMAAVVFHSLQHLDAADLQAMAVYLKTEAQRAAAAAPTTPPRPVALSATQRDVGARVYRDQCAGCHGEQGEGVAGAYPPLAGSQTARSRNAINAIRIVLNGGYPPSTAGNPRPYGMPPYYPFLKDEEIAAVVSYVRASWGNAAPGVTALEVARARGVPTE